MKRFRLGLIGCSLFLFLVGLSLAGCGGWLREDDDDLPGSGGGGGFVLKKEALKPYSGKGTGTIKGVVLWEGAEPSPADLKFVKDEDHCSKGGEYEKVNNSLWVGGKGRKALGNVFVWLEPPKGHYFVVPKDQLAPFKDTAVRMHQPHCAFLPHCVLLFPQYYKDGENLEPTGQKLVIVNDAEVGHNAKVDAPGGGNQTLPPGKDWSMVLEPTDKPNGISCGIHPWMQGYIGSFPHPYAALTSVGADLTSKPPVWQNRDAANFGEYEIKGVPAGVKVTVVAWHEADKVLTGLGRKEVTVKAGGTETVEFKVRKK